MKLEKYLTEIVNFIKEQVQLAKAKGVIVGLSGGIDSAVVALLMQKAFPENHLCVLLPCQSDPIDVKYAEKLVEKKHLKAKLVDLTMTFEQLKNSLNYNSSVKKSQLILGNVKARLRMTTLYALAQEYGYLVVGTDNADEWHIGYFTKYGDGGVDMLPIIHLLKQDVVASAKILGVTNEIISRKPSASLWPEQTDEAEMQFKYEQLDQYLMGNQAGLPSKVVERIEMMHQTSQHKRVPVPQAPEWKIKERK